MVTDKPDPTPGSIWRHYNGIPYKVLFLANTEHAVHDHPIIVVYEGLNGNKWARPLSDWQRSFICLD